MFRNTEINGRSNAELRGESAPLSSVSPNPGAMGVLENKARARLFYKYLSKVYDQVNPFI